MKWAFYIFLMCVFNQTTFGQNRTCKSLHVGTFKASSKEYGTTIITRTKNLQVEENNDLGYKLVYNITWTSECTYELKLKQVLKGDPYLMNDSKYVLKVRIKQIKKDSYVTENTSTFSDKISNHEIMIIK